MAALEKTIVGIFDELKKEIPNFNRITFVVANHTHGKVQGFFHIGNGCKSYDNIEDLAILLSDRRSARAKNPILFRKFT